jgi:L-asparaginase/Glu-tRNA(Gln) amidotransferase subunit D
MTIINLYCALVLCACSVFLTVYVWSKFCDVLETRRFAKMKKKNRDAMKSALADLAKTSKTAADKNHNTKTK